MKTDSAPRSAPLARRTANLPATTATRTPAQVEPAIAAVAPIRFPTWGRLLTLALVVGFALLLLVHVSNILDPFVWAMVVSYAFHPAISWLTRRTGLPRVWCVALPFVAVVGLLIWLITLIVPNLSHEAQAMATTLPTFLNELYQHYANNAQDLDVFGFRVNAQQAVAGIGSSLTDISHAISHQAMSVATGAVDTLARLLIFFISTFYLLLDGARLGTFLKARLPQRYQHEITGLASRIDGVLGQYLRAQLLLIGIMSCASFVVLTVMGVRFAIVLAIIAGTLEIFPVIGPMAAIVLVSLASLIQPNHFGLSHAGFALIIALIFFVLRQVEDYFVIPSIVGHVVQLHPLLILFALFCGSSIAGVLGMFLAVPLTGALRIVLGFLYVKVVE